MCWKRWLDLFSKRLGILRKFRTASFRRRWRRRRTSRSFGTQVGLACQHNTKHVFRQDTRASVLQVCKFASSGGTKLPSWLKTSRSFYAPLVLTRWNNASWHSIQRRHLHVSTHVSTEMFLRRSSMRRKASVARLANKSSTRYPGLFTAKADSTNTKREWRIQRASSLDSWRTQKTGIVSSSTDLPSSSGSSSWPDATVPSRLSSRHRGMQLSRLLTSALGVLFYLSFHFPTFCTFFSSLVDFSSSDDFGSSQPETSRPSELLRLERIPSILLKPSVNRRCSVYSFSIPYAALYSRATLD